MAHFFQAAKGERARERESEQKQLIWLLAILTTTSDPDEGFIYLYIYIRTIPLALDTSFPLCATSHVSLYRFMVEGKTCPAVE